jgi:glyoxalase family protein
MSKIRGIHHVTAIAGNAQQNLEFYRDVLGLRLVKKTVNFDDPGTYHFYFGNYEGTPGTIMTFFPWEHITRGTRGSSQATETAFRVPQGSLDFWVKRFEKYNVIFNKPSKRFEEGYLVFLDPDGLKLELVETKEKLVSPYHYAEIPENKAIAGFHNSTLTVNDYKATEALLTDVFGYKMIGQEVNRYRYSSGENVVGNMLDLVHLPDEHRGVIAGGSVHHVAFRTESLDSQLDLRQKIIDFGLQPTPQIDRDYFMSIYFREPQGVLFEIATDPPGFTIDEDLADLGTSLKLPKQHESRRAEIETMLQKIENCHECEEQKNNT